MLFPTVTLPISQILSGMASKQKDILGEAVFKLYLELIYDLRRPKPL